jgi:hypothetical protein
VSVGECSSARCKLALLNLPFEATISSEANIFFESVLHRAIQRSGISLIRPDILGNTRFLEPKIGSKYFEKVFRGPVFFVTVLFLGRVGCSLVSNSFRFF